MNDRFMPRLHSPNPDHPTWAKCGRFTSGVIMADSDDQVTCGHCMRKLGHDPRKALAAAVQALVAEYDTHQYTTGEMLDHVATVAKAWHAEQNYLATRRYYR